MVKTLFTSRLGGVSTSPFDTFNLAAHVGDEPFAVAKNRQILSGLIAIPESRIFYMNQVHGCDVAIIDERSDSKIAPSVDALFTTLPGVALVTLIADCTPLLLKSDRAIAAVHVGRRGLVAEVFEATLKSFSDHGITKDEITGEIGPSICVDCYQVDLETYNEVVNRVPESGTDQSRRCIDVAKGLQARMRKYGIQYRASSICVNHTPGYFSYRRDGVTGRQAGVIWR